MSNFLAAFIYFVIGMLAGAILLLCKAYRDD